MPASFPWLSTAMGRGERAYDIYSLLLKERIVFLGTKIDDQVANVIVAQLLYLNSLDQKKQINLYINSPGGSVYAGLAIYDAMQMIQAPVSTVAVGVSASMGTALLTSGCQGETLCLASRHDSHASYRWWSTRIYRRRTHCYP